VERKRFLMGRIASRHRDPFDQRRCFERLRVHRQVAGLTFCQRLQIAQLCVQQHGGAPHPPDQLIVSGSAMTVPHLEDV